ncbi:MAG: YebC/PmpR family DNA-binding transcriptional regulator [Parcubacteria group bacterium]|jgi:YebC/PmpR family DNA-binding regulatory protein
MSGHSHFAGIKQRKGVNDAKRANVFTKLGRFVTIAAREGGGNPEFNFKLKMAIEQARYANMPKDNIDKAIKRGTGELKDGAEIQEVMYEAYGPGQVAMLIKAATDNKNRTLGEIKNVLAKGGGKMVAEGAVSFMFKQVGCIEIAIEDGEKDNLEILAIEAGADDISYEDGVFSVYTKIEDLKEVKENIEKSGLNVESAGLIYVPTQKTSISEKDKESYEKLLEALDDLDDVQEIFDNL